MVTNPKILIGIIWFMKRHIKSWPKKYPIAYVDSNDPKDVERRRKEVLEVTTRVYVSMIHKILNTMIKTCYINRKIDCIWIFEKMYAKYTNVKYIPISGDDYSNIFTKISSDFRISEFHNIKINLGLFCIFGFKR